MIPSRSTCLVLLAVAAVLGDFPGEAAAMGARPPYPPVPPAPAAEAPVAEETPACLAQNDPNPVGESTAIRFRLPERIPAVLTVFDIAGRRVRTLVDGDGEAGEQSVTWDRRDFTGRLVPPGIYFYRLEATGIDETRKMVVLR